MKFEKYQDIVFKKIVQEKVEWLSNLLFVYVGLCAFNRVLGNACLFY